jgi:hypothetical protein
LPIDLSLGRLYQDPACGPAGPLSVSLHELGFLSLARRPIGHKLRLFRFLRRYLLFAAYAGYCSAERCQPNGGLALVEGRNLEGTGFTRTAYYRAHKRRKAGEPPTHENDFKPRNF